ncbi:MAG: hypothetical protein D3925_02285 [Candidatus Electrothrix sp. AR5]|nr:hypothetical protein [Candidatus Electrothrix sp. AR5]
MHNGWCKSGSVPDLLFVCLLQQELQNKNQSFFFNPRIELLLKTTRSKYLKGKHKQIYKHICKTTTKKNNK